MNITNPKDSRHKSWLYRVLSAFYDDAFLAGVLAFKGGTCAAMLGLLDRFSVDLDFDFIGDEIDLKTAQDKIQKIVKKLGLEIKDQSKTVPQYFLKYKAPQEERNTIKIDMLFPPPQNNKYEPKRFQEVDRIINCQTSETMFSNKLVALINRFEKTGKIAGRDVYDIHHFFENGLKYDEAIIEERTAQSSRAFFRILYDFIENEITEKHLTQDLNVLVPYEKFKVMRKTLKQETLMFIQDEIRRLG